MCHWDIYHFYCFMPRWWEEENFSHLSEMLLPHCSGSGRQHGKLCLAKSLSTCAWALGPTAASIHSPIPAALPAKSLLKHSRYPPPQRNKSQRFNSGKVSCRLPRTLLSQCCLIYVNMDGMLQSLAKEMANDNSFWLSVVFDLIIFCGVFFLSEDPKIH